MDIEEMNWAVLLFLIAINIPIGWKIKNFFFRDTPAFIDALMSWLIPGAYSTPVGLFPLMIWCFLIVAFVSIEYWILTRILDEILHIQINR